MIDYRPYPLLFLAKSHWWNRHTIFILPTTNRHNLPNFLQLLIKNADMWGQSPQSDNFFLLLIYLKNMQRFTLIYFFLFLFNTLRNFSRLLLHPCHHISCSEIDISYIFWIGLHLLHRNLLGIDVYILLLIGYALAYIGSKIFETNLHLFIHVLVDYLIKNVDQTNHQKKGLIWTMQYEASQLLDKFNLVIAIPPHFLLQILNGIIIEVGHIEIDVELI